MTDHDVYVTTLRVDEIFADDTYQRVLDVKRARTMTGTWDRRLAGIIEVSDRGETHTPRYAVIDGQHRWAAARYLEDPPQLVANVHENLTPADEAALFDKLNRQRRQPTTWDHWRARRKAGDLEVLAIENIVESQGLRVHEQSGKDGVITCVSTLEKIAGVPLVGHDLLKTTLHLLNQAWGSERDAYDAPIVGGLAVIVFTFDVRLDGQRLIDAMAQMPPRRVRFTAAAMRDHTPGSLMKLTALTLIAAYNKQPGKKLLTPPGWTGNLPRIKKPRARD